MEKEEAIDIFGSKHVSKFTDVETPEGNLISGWMCRSRESMLGSLILTHTNEYQLVRAFPKIHYMDKDWEQRNRGHILNILEKRDGTCVQFYPLKDDNNEIIEVVPKTRETPVMFSDLQEKLYSIPLYDNFVNMCESWDATICAEMFGVGNIHEIPYGEYWDQDLTLEGIGIFDWSNMWHWYLTEDMFDEYQIPTPFNHLNTEAYNSFTSKEYTFEFSNEFVDWYSEWLDKDTFDYDVNSLTELYEILENEVYQNIIKNAGGRCVIEGSVWHTSRGLFNHMLKNKAISVRKNHILKAGVIPPAAIKHVLMKAKEEFDEKIFKERFADILPYLKLNLSEEFDDDKINKSEPRMKSIWKDFTEDRETSGTIKKYVDVIHEEIGKDAQIEDKMRKFGELFPDKKNIAGKMYDAFLHGDG